MKRIYQRPFADSVLQEPELMLATSDSFSGTGEDITFDSESDFDSFFGV